jgi:hypothetical protein
MNNINLISKIIDYNSTLLYNFLCVNKDFNKNILNNITSLHLLKYNKINLKLNLIENLKILILDNINNITDNELKYIPNIHTLKMYHNEKITDEGLKYISNIHTLNLFSNENITDEGLMYISNINYLN